MVAGRPPIRVELVILTAKNCQRSVNDSLKVVTYSVHLFEQT